MNESLELLKRAEVYQLDCYLSQDSSLDNWGRASDYFLETSSFRESEYAYLKYIEDANEVNLVATGQNYTICFLIKVRDLIQVADMISLYLSGEHWLEEYLCRGKNFYKMKEVSTPTQRHLFKIGLGSKITKLDAMMTKWIGKNDELF